MIKESTAETTANWTEIITPKAHLLDLRLKQVWKYRDLLFLLIRRDFVATYKQTILGPIWFVLQPLLTSLTFIIIFSRIAGISTDGIPSMLFYLAGLTPWNYFSESLNKTATVFRDNAGIFGKVYFPRLVMPLSIIASNIIKLLIQLTLFITVWSYYLFFTDYNLQPNLSLLLLPILIILMGGLGLGFGMLISAMTTKYRDLVFLLTFGIQLLMYATPIIYPLSSISEKFKVYFLLNPLSSIIETFRYAFTGHGHLNWLGLLYSTCFTLGIIVLGAIVFNKVEKTFMDTV